MPQYLGTSSRTAAQSSAAAHRRAVATENRLLGRRQSSSCPLSCLPPAPLHPGSLVGHGRGADTGGQALRPSSISLTRGLPSHCHVRGNHCEWSTPPPSHAMLLSTESAMLTLKPPCAARSPYSFPSSPSKNRTINDSSRVTLPGALWALGASYPAVSETDRSIVLIPAQVMRPIHCVVRGRLGSLAKGVWKRRRHALRLRISPGTVKRCGCGQPVGCHVSRRSGDSRCI